MTAVLYILLALTLLAIVIALSGIRQVSQSQCAIIERLGRFHKILSPGLSFVIPFLDRTKYVGNLNLRGKEDVISSYRIDLREQVLDIPKQEVITKDNVEMDVDTLIFYQIVEAQKIVYEISAPVEAIRQISRTTIRNIFGGMELDASLEARSFINEKLRTILDEATDKWGVKVLRVEIQDISPPPELKKTMQQQMIAERNRRARVTNAEADKRERVLSAEGESEAIRLVQEATAAGLDVVRNVLGKTAGTQGLIVLETLKAQQEIAKNLASGESTKLFLPTDIAGLYGAIGGIKEILASSAVSATMPDAQVETAVSDTQGERTERPPKSTPPDLPGESGSA